MKILLCLNKDIFTNLALNIIAPYLLEHNLIITFSTSVGSPEEHMKTLKDIENNDIGDTITCLNKNEVYLSFDQIIQKYNITEKEMKNINSAESVSYLKNEEVDLIISIRYGKILHNEVIDIPKKGVLNLHPGRLPEYAGILAGFYAIFDNKKTLGITLHYIDQGIDSGDIVDIVDIDIQKSESFFWNMVLLYKAGAKMFANNLQLLFQNGDLPKKKQEISKRKYYTYPSEEQVKYFLTKYNAINKKDYGRAA